MGVMGAGEGVAKPCAVDVLIKKTEEEEYRGAGLQHGEL